MRVRESIVCLGIMALVACGPSGPTVNAPSVKGQRIVVMEFSTADATVAYSEPIDALGLSLAEQIAAGLRQRGHTAEAFSAGRVPEGDVVIRGQFTLIDAGSRALRYFVGFGAGAAKVKVSGEVVKADGTPIATFADGRGSGFGMFGGSSTGLVAKCMRRIAGDIVRMADTGEYVHQGG